MLPVVLLALGPWNQAAFGVVVDHGGGQGIFLVKAQDLAVHVGEHLVHIQREVRQLVPGHRALGAHPVQQRGQIVH